MKNYTETMNRIMKAEVDEGRVKGNSALVFKNGMEVYYGEFGYADAEKEKPMKRDTIIRLFSMTKPITAVAAMIAQERGLIDLNDPVSMYLPEYANMNVLKEVKDDEGKVVSYEEVPASGAITIMNLMTMTSGIPYGEDWEGCSEVGRRMQVIFDEIIDGINKGERISTREVVRRIALNPLMFEPGERWMYGLSADILAAVIEVATGERYGEFLKKEIFDPLQMPDTGFFVPKEKWDRFAMSYDYIPKKETKTGENEFELVAADSCHLGEYYHEDVAYEAGGCGLVSTIDDYAHFAMMLANGGIYKGQRIISSASVKFLATNHLTSEQTAALDWDSNRGYGYGCLMRVLVNQGRAGSQASLGEFGWDGWTGNYMCIDPEKKLALLYFIQRRGAGTTPLVRKLRAVTYGALD
ncbi:MAG: beta-lactamase family protein [Lachnospiraceae bacterium]|nr:beta-lactamase family protein [Lachnospiraceae bacterium]